MACGKFSSVVVASVVHSEVVVVVVLVVVLVVVVVVVDVVATGRGAAWRPQYFVRSKPYEIIDKFL